jgi:type II secretory pathway pseudopilin PulG
MNVMGRAKYEIVIVVIIVVLAVALAMGLYAGRTKIHNGKRLVNELQAMRTGIELYMTLNRSVPPTLETLAKSTYDSGDGTQRPYLENIPIGGKGKMMDPFGHPYKYDSKTGYVCSTTPGYQNW